MEHDDWLAERRNSMGASDIAAASSGRYGGATKAVASKLDLPTGDDIDPALADRGHRWEQPIADGVLAHTGLIVAAEQMLIRNPATPWIHTTLDGVLVAKLPAVLSDVAANLEIKTRSPDAPWPRDYWFPQVQVGMWCTGARRSLLAIATVDTDYDPVSGTIVELLRSVHYNWMERDELEIARLVELGRWLWDHVERGVLPEPTDAGALPYIKAANMAADPTATADLDDLAGLVERREQLRAAAKSAEAEEKTIEAQIRHRMGGATEATTSDGRWRVRCGLPIRKFTSQSEADFLELYGAEAAEWGVTRTVLDRDKAKELMPEQFDDARIATPDRRLTVKDLRPEESNQ
jgi:predicted phage-related endonuclease